MFFNIWSPWESYIDLKNLHPIKMWKPQRKRYLLIAPETIVLTYWGFDTSERTPRLLCVCLFAMFYSYFIFNIPSISNVVKLSGVWVTIDGVWIGDGIYWTLWYRAWLHFKFTMTLTHTILHSHVVTSRCSVAASNGKCSPYSWFPNYPRTQLPASNSNNSRELYSKNPLTDWLTD
jgi:hypothetical protein